jgi:hypothetical protein
MNTHSVRHPTRELGTGWFVLPLAGAVVALALLAAWPELFSEPLPDDAGALASVPAAPFASTDPQVPSASSVFKDGASYETAQHVDTF